MNSLNAPDQKGATSSIFNPLCIKPYAGEEPKQTYAQEITQKRRQQLTFGNNTQDHSKQESPNNKIESKRSSHALLNQFRQFITGQSSRQPYENLKSQKVEQEEDRLQRSKSQTMHNQDMDLMQELKTALSPVRKIASKEGSIRLSHQFSS